LSGRAVARILNRNTGKRLYMAGGYRQEIREIIKHLLELKKLELVEGAICIDPIHINIRIPPKEAVAAVMGYLKGKSALMLFDRHPEWRKRCGRYRTFWARGYYVSTVGLNEEVIKKYIRNQEDADRISNDI
jgi:putative transposase